MRNIVFLRDTFFRFSPCDFVKDRINTRFNVVSIVVNISSEVLYVLCQNGYVLLFNIVENYERLPFYYKLQGNSAITNDDQWFLIEYIDYKNELVCLSHSGAIEIIKSVDGMERGEIDFQLNDSEQVGVVDGGISSAAWSPDKRSLVIVNENNTIMSMSTNWEGVEEIPIEARCAGTETGVSWCGDGELFVVSTQDANDNITRARIFTATMDQVAVSRVMSGTGVLRGLETGVAFAPSGSMITCAQKKTRTSLQVISIIREFPC